MMNVILSEIASSFEVPRMLRRISKPGWLYIAGCSCLVISLALAGDVLLAIAIAGVAFLFAAFICGLKREIGRLP